MKENLEANYLSENKKILFDIYTPAGVSSPVGFTDYVLEASLGRHNNLIPFLI